MSKKQKLYCITGVGTFNKICFKSIDTALEAFKFFSSTEIIKLERKYIDKVELPDKDGYIPSDTFYYRKKDEKEVHLKARDFEIYTKEELEKIEKEREEKREKLKKEKKEDKE